MSADAEHRQCRAPYWFGVLCAETREEIADRLRELLEGQHFTVVCANSFSADSEKFTSIEVHPSQWLTAPLRVDADDDTEWAGIGWSTPRQVMGVHTRAKTRSEGHDGRPHDWVHFNFERGRVVIDHYAPSRNRLQWILAVEEHSSEYGPTAAGEQL